MRIWLVHGFNVKDRGKNTVQKLGQKLKERISLDVENFTYGWTGLFGASFYSDNFATSLANLTDEGDIAIGHSNGCNVIHQAAEQGGTFRQTFFIAPALDRSTTFPLNVEECHVLHSKRDKVLYLGSLIPFHPWGTMGKYGAIPEKYKNIDCTPRVSGHSNYFSEENLEWLSNLITERILKSHWG